MADEEWAAKRAKEIKEEREERKIEQEHAVIKDRFIRTHAPDFWNQVKEVVKHQVEVFNSKMQETDMIYDDGDPFHIQIRTTQNAAMQNLQFDENTWKIRVYDGKSITYTVSVKDVHDEMQLLFVDEVGIPHSTEEIGIKAVENYSRVIR
jgi:ribosomal protein L21E